MNWDQSVHYRHQTTYSGATSVLPNKGSCHDPRPKSASNYLRKKG